VVNSVLSLPNVGPENFWGRPTFRRGGYVQVNNDGAMRHEGFDLAVSALDSAACGRLAGRARDQDLLRS